MIKRLRLESWQEVHVDAHPHSCAHARTYQVPAGTLVTSKKIVGDYLQELKLPLNSYNPPPPPKYMQASMQDLGDTDTVDNASSNRTSPTPTIQHSYPSALRGLSHIGR